MAEEGRQLVELGTVHDRRLFRGGRVAFDLAG